MKHQGKCILVAVAITNTLLTFPPFKNTSVKVKKVCGSGFFNPFSPKQQPMKRTRKTEHKPVFVTIVIIVPEFKAHLLSDRAKGHIGGPSQSCKLQKTHGAALVHSVLATATKVCCLM